MSTTLNLQPVGRTPQPAAQDYLKAIHVLTVGRRVERARTKAIADHLGVSAPSVSGMLDRLAADGLVDYIHYAGARLTLPGSVAAVAVIRRHRLLELYLNKVLGLGWDEVHAEAELLEHALTARVEAAMDAALGFPSLDPHGDPIPGPDGTFRQDDNNESLWDCAGPGALRVARVVDTDADLLRHFRQLGFVPGARLSHPVRESGGLMRVRVGRREERIGREAAEQVYVTRG